MNQLKKASVGLSLAITVGLLYSLCGMAVTIFPNAIAAALNLVVHSLNMALLTDSPPTLTVAGFAMGLLGIMTYSFIAGYLYALVYNFVAGKQAIGK
ncbi:MAG: DUF5676 family membrane protein [Arenimonas sp.]